MYDKIEWYKTRLGAIMLRHVESKQTYYLQNDIDINEFLSVRGLKYEDVPTRDIYESEDYEGYFDNLKDLMLYYGDTSDEWGKD